MSHDQPESPQTSTHGLRIDRWLWCARFFKSRSLAQQAVEGGHVQVNGERAKASRQVKVGDRLRITRERERFEVEVIGIPERRGPATEARTHYAESAESEAARAAVREFNRLTAPVASGRPDKRERRDLLKFQKGRGQGLVTASLSSRSTRLFMMLTAFFVGNAIVAEFVGVKIFALEPTLGLPPFGWNLFGQQGSLSFTAGVLIWPIVFIMTDVINEYFGRRGVRFISFAAAGMITYAFVFAYAAIHLAPAEWWVGVNADRGVPDMQAAYANVFGQGLWTIGGSLVAFLVGQVIDVTIYHRIRAATGERWIWLRATGSTAFSQLVDSFVVLYIAFVLGPQQWPISLFLAVGTVNYCYKMVMAVLLSPLIYLARHMIERYLGPVEAARLKAEAAAD